MDPVSHLLIRDVTLQLQSLIDHLHLLHLGLKQLVLVSDKDIIMSLVSLEGLLQFQVVHASVTSCCSGEVPVGRLGALLFFDNVSIILAINFVLSSIVYILVLFTYDKVLQLF